MVKGLLIRGAGNLAGAEFYVLIVPFQLNIVKDDRSGEM